MTKTKLKVDLNPVTLEKLRIIDYMKHYSHASPFSGLKRAYKCWCYDCTSYVHCKMELVGTMWQTQVLEDCLLDLIDCGNYVWSAFVKFGRGRF